MAVSTGVFDVGETLVDEAAAYERWEAEGATTFVFTDRDLHAGPLSCAAALRARLGSSERGSFDVVSALAPRLHAVRLRRGAHAPVASPQETVTIDSLAELREGLVHV